MQIGFTLVDWKELEKFGTSESFEIFLEETEGEAPWIIDGYDAGLGGDSATYQGAVRDALLGALPLLTAEDRTVVERSVIPILDDVPRIDDFGFGEDHGYYYLSAEPAKLKEIARDWRSISPKEISALLIENLPEDDFAIEERGVEELQLFFEQFQTALTYGAERDMGLLMSIG